MRFGLALVFVVNVATAQPTTTTRPMYEPGPATEHGALKVQKERAKATREANCRANCMLVSNRTGQEKLACVQACREEE